MTEEKLMSELEGLRARIFDIPTSSREICFVQAKNEETIKELKKKVDEESTRYLNDLILKVVSVYVLYKKSFCFSGDTMVFDDYFVALDKYEENGNSLYWRIGVVQKFEEIKKRFKFFSYKVSFKKRFSLLTIGCYAMYDGKTITVKIFPGNTAIQPLGMEVADFIIQHGEVLNFILEEEITKLSGDIAASNFEQLGNLEAQAHLLEGMGRGSVSMEITKVKIGRQKSQEEIIRAMLNLR